MSRKKYPRVKDICAEIRKLSVSSEEKPKVTNQWLNELSLKPLEKVSLRVIEFESSENGSGDCIDHLPYLVAKTLGSKHKNALVLADNPDKNMAISVHDIARDLEVDCIALETPAGKKKSMYFIDVSKLDFFLDAAIRGNELCIAVTDSKIPKTVDEIRNVAMAGLGVAAKFSEDMEGADLYTLSKHQATDLKQSIMEVCSQEHVTVVTDN